MDRKANIARFEAEMSKVKRPGVDKLMDYIRKSDFYAAPASTKFHLSCEGGLLQHSINVLDALRCFLTAIDEEGSEWLYTVAGCPVATIPDESVIIAALLHDICKTYFYTTSWRNAKNEKTGKWEKVPFYTVDDKMPLGHGPKSAMIIKQYMELTTEEMYAIWWHMGFADGTSDALVLGQAIEKFPFILALHTADMMASRFMEGEEDNHPAFRTVSTPTPESAGEYADNPVTTDAGPQFEEAPAIVPASIKEGS